MDFSSSVICERGTVGQTSCTMLDVGSKRSEEEEEEEDDDDDDDDDDDEVVVVL